MTLHDADYRRLAFLLGKQRRMPLEAREKAEIREIIERQNPVTRDLDWDGLIRYGYTLFGAYLFARGIEGATS